MGAKRDGSLPSGANVNVAGEGSNVVSVSQQLTPSQSATMIDTRIDAMAIEIPTEEGDTFFFFIAIAPMIVDIVIVFLFVGIILAFVLMSPTPSVGFFCNEEIRYPFVPGVKRIASTSLFNSIIAIQLLLPIVAVEGCFAYFVPSDSQFLDFLINTYKHIGSTVLGFLMNGALCGLVKHTTGRCAPNFFDVCRPENVSFQECSESRAFVEKFTCHPHDGLRQNSLDVHYSQMSFYSAYASCSMHAALYSTMYVHTRLKRNSFGCSLRPLIQFALIGSSLTIGLLQLADYMHHWSDVFFGFFMGIITAVYSAMVISEMFKKKSRESAKEYLGKKSVRTAEGATCEATAVGLTEGTTTGAGPKTAVDSGDIPMDDASLLPGSVSAVDETHKPIAAKKPEKTDRPRKSQLLPIAFSSRRLSKPPVKRVKSARDGVLRSSDRARKTGVLRSAITSRIASRKTNKAAKSMKSVKSTPGPPPESVPEASLKSKSVMEKLQDHEAEREHGQGKVAKSLQGSEIDVEPSAPASAASSSSSEREQVSNHSEMRRSKTAPKKHSSAADLDTVILTKNA